MRVKQTTWTNPYGDTIVYTPCQKPGHPDWYHAKCQKTGEEVSKPNLPAAKAFLNRTNRTLSKDWKETSKIVNK